MKTQQRMAWPDVSMKQQLHCRRRTYAQNSEKHDKLMIKIRNIERSYT